MAQQHELILNKSFSQNETQQSSSLQLKHNYWVYSQQIGGGVSNEFNIKAYLNRPQNQPIINQFINYLESNTSLEELREIFYNDVKLSKVFNHFFSTTIQNGQISGQAIIEENLENTITIIVSDNLWNWNGEAVTTLMTGTPESIENADRNQSVFNKVVANTSSEGYFIPVKLDFNFSQIPRNKFKICDDFINPQLFNLNGFIENDALNDLAVSLTTEAFVQSLTNSPD